MSYEKVALGPEKVGFGSMSLTTKADPITTEQGIETLEYVTTDPEVKVSFINGGDFYGPDLINLKLLNKYFESVDDEVAKNIVLSIKGCVSLPHFEIACGKEDVARSIGYIMKYFPKSPSRPKILFEPARVDPKIPYKDVIKDIAEYVKKGDIDGISISEVEASHIEEAVQVFPISAVEVEFSFLSLDATKNGVLETCAKYDIPVVAYSPIGRGLITDYAVEKQEAFLNEIPSNDIRRTFDRFQKDAFDHNSKITKSLYDLAHKKHVTLERFALSWIIKASRYENYLGVSKFPRLIPIPSSSSKERVDMNFKGFIDLSDEDMKEIEQILTSSDVVGGRYH